MKGLRPAPTAARFRDRSEAGRELASVLQEYAHRDDVVVLALPRGGVPVGFEIAKRLQLPLDVLIVRKLGVPFQPELAMGAIASGDVIVVNDEVVQAAGISPEELEEETARERAELKRRERVYRGERQPSAVHGHVVLLVDDGLATGSTMRAAIHALRRQSPREIVVAVPVAPVQTCQELRRDADAVVCLRTPEPFLAIGVWYESFPQISDDEIRELLAESDHARS